MRRTLSRTGYASAILVAGMLAVGPALADKPSWAGGEKGDHRQAREHGRDASGAGAAQSRSRDTRSRIQAHGYFDDRHRELAHAYYRERVRSGHCPPGLAKKHNRCMPPGQARKWAIGRPLPREVIYYDVPQQLVAELGRPPAGYRYARVANDILLLALGTGLVVDAIKDLGTR